MTCGETQHFLGAYVDSELGRAEKAAVEVHLQECRSCTGVLAGLKSLASALQEGSLKFKAPRHLKPLIVESLQRKSRGVTPSFAHWQWVGSAAAIVLIFGLVWTMPTWTARSSVETQLIGEIVSSHVRSMMANHLTDIRSSDAHNVKPWFADKLDYSPPAKDLSAQGFPLVGGRMDYLGNRQVAALVYQRNQHLINLFVWPADQGSEKPETRSAIRGYNLIHWTKGGMTYWLISDLNPEELTECGGLLRE